MIYFAVCHKIDHYFLASYHMDMRGNLNVTDHFNNFTTDPPAFDKALFGFDEINWIY